MKILLLSDTHSFIDEAILKHVAEADEIWHAGDIGNIKVADAITKVKPLKAVYGNIDDHTIRITFPEVLSFNCEGIKILMTHIGGSPGSYNPGIRKLLDEIKPDVFICGHSHILKVMRDQKRNLIHLNPGAAGIHGFHKVRTILRFQINKAKLENLDVIELGLRGELPQTISGTN